jgi:hypothetical protein
LRIFAWDTQQPRQAQVVIAHGNDKQLLLAMDEYGL